MSEPITAVRIIPSDPPAALDDLKARKAHCGQDPMGNSVDTKSAIPCDTRPGPARFINDRIVPMSVHHRLLPVVSFGKVVRPPEEGFRIVQI